MNPDVLIPMGKSLTVWRENLRRQVHRHTNLHNLTTPIQKPLF